MYICYNEAMECPYCNAELIVEDWYGHKVHGEHYWIEGHWKKDGDIYRCPNHEGFDSEEEAREYDPDHEGDWEEITCESACHSISGSFYDKKNGELQEGYPC